MATFYLLHEGFYEGVDQRIDLLRNAAQARGLRCEVLDSLTCDYSNLPAPVRGDLLYNCARGSTALENLLLQSEVTSFYRSAPGYIANQSTVQHTMRHLCAGLPSPKTIFAISNDRQLLRRYVDYLGGFPIVVKAEVSARGIGTMKIDSWTGLISLADHLVTTGQKYILREFIDAPYGVRAMVLGDRVVASLKFMFPDGDFRNAALASDIRYAPASLAQEHEALCVRATQLANLEMSGVDLLFDREGRAYLLENNFPSGFQSLSGDPWRIQDQWVDHLLRKARENSLGLSNPGTT